METEEENSSHSSDKEEVLVCEICQEILLGKKGERDTLLKHMVEWHHTASEEDEPSMGTQPTRSAEEDTANQRRTTQWTKTT